MIRSGAQNPNNLAEGFGYRVTLETKYGTAVYGHMNGTPAVKEGDVVSAGDSLEKLENQVEARAIIYIMKEEIKIENHFPQQSKNWTICLTT